MWIWLGKGAFCIQCLYKHQILGLINTRVVLWVSYIEWSELGVDLLGSNNLKFFLEEIN